MIVDTSVLVNLERRFLRAGQRPLESLPDQCFVAAIQIAELMIGVLLADSPTRREARNVFVSRIRGLCRTIPFGEREAERFASLYVQLRREGAQIGEHDLQIAATALAHGHSVMTANVAEFSRVEGLTLVPIP